MGTKKRRVERERSGRLAKEEAGGNKEKTVGWKKQNLSFDRVRSSMGEELVLVRTP
jgi:hypothetical protein